MTVAFGAATTAFGRAASFIYTPPDAVGTLVRLVVTAVSTGQDFDSSAGHAGWTLVSNMRGSTTDTTAAPRSAAYYRILDGTAADTYSATFPSATVTAYIIHSNPVTGADRTSPIGATVSKTPATGTTTELTTPGLTGARKGLLAYVGAQSFSTIGTTATITPPTGMNGFAQSQDGTRLSMILAQATEPYSTPGAATGARTGTSTATSNYTASLVLWAEPPEAASARVRIAGLWVDKPVLSRAAGLFR